MQRARCLAWSCTAALAWVATNAVAGPLSSLLVACAASATQAGAPIVSGDLIVKFRDASEPGAQLTAVLGGQRSIASVAPLAARLSADLDLPLVLVQVTSGREALLALDRTALTRALLARAGSEATVQRATAVGAAPAAGLPSAEMVLRLELRRGTSTSTQGALAQRLAAGGLTRPRVQAESGGGALRLHYDIDALTLALIAKLQQRSDVEYVQANRLLRPSSPAASGAPR